MNIQKLKRIVKGFYTTPYWSQYGEDLVYLDLIRKNVFPQKGFYVDLGCNEPKNLSQTFTLYQRGWNGVCVDLDERVSNKFKKIRPNDMFMNVAILPGSDEREVEVNIGVSTLHSRLKSADDLLIERGIYHDTTNEKTKKVSGLGVNKLLERYSPGKIDLLSVDIEGSDEEIIQSIDYEKFEIRAIILEHHCFKNSDGSHLLETSLYRFLEARDYVLASMNLVNALMVKKHILRY